MNSFFNKWKSVWRRIPFVWRLPSLLVLGLVFVGIVAMLHGWWTSRASTHSSLDTLTPSVIDTSPSQSISAFFHPLTGLPSVNQVKDRPTVFAVMIENSADAWPLSGLNQAFLVIEAPAEGAIPRFIAFFSEETDVQKIGPVRSARPYYLDWAEEFSALYAHVGGSAEALRLLPKKEVFNIDEYYNTSTFWRSSDRFAPHNVYVSGERLRTRLEKIPADSIPEPAYGLWQFSHQALDKQTDPIEITLSAPSSLYRVTWNYHPDTHQFERFQAGNPFFMEDGTSIHASNVAVMVTDIHTIDSVGRLRIRTLGEGKALVFQDGRKISGTWKKKIGQDRLRFFNDQGMEILWNPGATWIQVVSSFDQVTMTKDGQE